MIETDFQTAEQEKNYYLFSNQEDAVKAAKDRGLCVFNFTPVVGKILSLDIDKEEHNPKRSGYVATLPSHQTTSAGGNKHVFIKLDYDIGPGYHALYATEMGSDQKREAVSRVRFDVFNDPLAYLTFETPEMAEGLRAWLRSCYVKKVGELVKEL